MYPNKIHLDYQCIFVWSILVYFPFSLSLVYESSLKCVSYVVDIVLMVVIKLIKKDVARQVLHN